MIIIIGDEDARHLRSLSHQDPASSRLKIALSLLRDLAPFVASQPETVLVPHAAQTTSTASTIQSTDRTRRTTHLASLEVDRTPGSALVKRARRAGPYTCSLEMSIEILTACDSPHLEGQKSFSTKH